MSEPSMEEPEPAVSSHFLNLQEQSRISRISEPTRVGGLRNVVLNERLAQSMKIKRDSRA